MLSGDDEELGCFKGISVAERLLVLLVKLAPARDLSLSCFDVRIFRLSSDMGFGFRLPGVSVLVLCGDELLNEELDFLFWLFEGLLAPDLILLDGLGLLLMTAVNTLSFFCVGVLRPLESCFFVVFSDDLTVEVSSTEEDEDFSLTFFTELEEEMEVILLVKAVSVSIRDVCRLKSTAEVED